jgi:hypothetical protein
VAVHSINLGYHNQGKNISILSTKSSYMDCIIRGATETQLQFNSINMEVGFCPRKSWKPPTYHLKEQKNSFEEQSVTLILELDH